MAVNALPPRHQSTFSGRHWFLVAGIVVVLFVLGIVALKFLFARNQEKPPEIISQGGHNLAMTPKSTQAAYVRPPDKAATKPPPAPQAATQGSPKPYLDPVLTGTFEAQNGDTGITNEQRKYGAPPPLAAAGAEGAPGGENDALAASLRPSDLGPAAKASVDYGYLYKSRAGQKAWCDMDVSVNSQLPGPVTCILATEIRNKTGTVLLAPKGSHLFGTLRSDVRFGNDRVPILWTQLETSDIPPIDIAINSPAADMLGEAGYKGTVNNHFWDTLFATAVYTLIEWGPALGIAALQNGQNSFNSFNFNTYGLTQPGQSMANRMLQKYMDRPPTLEGRVGKRIMIVFARELDFGPALSVRMARY